VEILRAKGRWMNVELSERDKDTGHLLRNFLYHTPLIVPVVSGFFESFPSFLLVTWGERKERQLSTRGKDVAKCERERKKRGEILN
jgi:hypothetical protein